MRHYKRTTLRRRGLAPLEFVLVLPIFLFVMALMINFGVVASWKIRALGVARNAAWGNRAPRSDADFYRPASWPETADYGAAEVPCQAQLNGPWISAIDPRKIVSGSADAASFFQGRAHLTRSYAMHPPGLPHQYDLTAKTELLDDNWDFVRMGLPDNESLRLPLILSGLQQGDWAEAYNQMLVAAYDRACWDVFREIYPRYPDMATPGPLWPLDRDDEFLYYGSLDFGPGIPEFHPILRFGCGGGAEARLAVDDLVNRLSDTDMGDNPARNMTLRFIELYQYVLIAYPGLTPQLRQQLQQNIDALEQYRDTL